jgi:hypothetical protein
MMIIARRAIDDRLNARKVDEELKTTPTIFIIIQR